MVENADDLAATVEAAMISKCRNNGQTCVYANRIYVQSEVHDTFTEKLVTAVNRMKIGDGFCDGVTTGPLITHEAVAKVVEHVEDAISKGAKVVAGGSHHELGGTFSNRRS